MSLKKIYKAVNWPVTNLANKTEFVYAFYNPITNLTKIGITQDVAQRLNQLSTASGCELEVINSIEINAEIDEPAKKVEEFLHSIFKEYRVRGEWFLLNYTQQKIISNFLDIVIE